MRNPIQRFVNRGPAQMVAYWTITFGVIYGVIMGVQHHSVAGGVFEGVIFGLVMGAVQAYVQRKRYRPGVTGDIRTQAQQAIKKRAMPDSPAVAQEMLSQIEYGDKQVTTDKSIFSMCIFGAFFVLGLFLAFTQSLLWLFTEALWIAFIIGTPLSYKRIRARNAVGRTNAQQFLSQ